MGDSDEDFEGSSSRQRRGKFRNEREDFNKRDNFRQADRSTSENNFNRPHNNSRHNNNHGNYRRNGGDKSPKYNRDGGYSPRRSDGHNNYANQPINSPPINNNQYGSRYDSHDNNVMYKRPLSPPGNGHFNHSHSMSGFNGHPGMPSQYFNDNRSSFPSQMPYRAYDDRPRSPENPAYFHDQAHKKQRSDWSGFNDMMPGSSYIEHDNRNSPEYFPDRFYDDYNQRALNNNNNNNNNNNMPMYNGNFNPQYDNNNFYPNPVQQQRGFGNPGFNQNNGYSNMYNNEMPHMNNTGNNFMLPQINPMMTSHVDKRNNNGNRGNQPNNGMGETQPPMISFKQFINNLNETDPSTSSLAPEEATKRYNDYKNDFRCTQIASFFANHKQEEWFKQRYHPEVSGKRKDEQRSAVLRRLGIFNDLLKRFNTDARRLSLDMSDPAAEKYLLKFIDACMIKLEEGTDEDLEILERIYKIENDNAEEKVSDEQKNGEVKKETDCNENKEETREAKTETTGPILIPQKVQSIFFKHLPVNVTRQDLEQIGGKYDGFKRASISEPAPERRFQRRGWITFDSTVNIKDICSKINGFKIQDMNLYPTINRELDQKIKCIIGLTNHKQIVQNDLKIITKIVEAMDKRWGLWKYSGSYSNNKLKDEDFQTDSDRRRLKKAEETAAKAETIADEEPDKTLAKAEKETPDIVAVVEANPLIELAKDYLNEVSNEQVEVKADEIADEKSPNSKASASSTFKLDVEKRAASLLDDLVLYLRVVHSIDYYNATEYQQEDWMPNRIGILHVRGSIAHKSSSGSNIVNIFNGVNINYFDAAAIKKNQVDEWLRLFEQHIKSYHEYRAEIDTDLAKRLGLKDLKEEIDKYIAANTKKLDKDVWLCPISGKKFKGPEYVKKYIETKCRDKLLELRADVVYFNRFVYDPKRPYLPEHPMTRNMGHNNNNNNNNSHSHQGNNNSYNKNSHGFNNQGMMNQGGQYSMSDHQFNSFNQGYVSSSFQHESYGYGGDQGGMMRGGGGGGGGRNNQQGYPSQPMGHMNNRPFRR